MHRDSRCLPGWDRGLSLAGRDSKSLTSCTSPDTLSHFSVPCLYQRTEPITHPPVVRGQGVGGKAAGTFVVLAIQTGTMMMHSPRSLSFSEHSVQGLCTLALSPETRASPSTTHSLVGRTIQPLALQTPNPACKAQTPPPAAHCSLVSAPPIGSYPRHASLHSVAQRHQAPHTLDPANECRSLCLEYLSSPSSGCLRLNC